MYTQNWFYQGACSLLRGILMEFYPCTLKGLEYVPRTGPFILAANHLSNIDPPFISCALRRELSFFAKAELFDQGFMQRIQHRMNCVAIRRDAQQNLQAFRDGFGMLKRGLGLLVFPGGRRYSPETVPTAKAGLGMLACRTQVPVVAARVFGTELALGIGAKRLTLDLPLALHIAPPLMPQEYDPGSQHPNRYEEAAERINQRIFSLHHPCEASVSPRP